MKQGMGGERKGGKWRGEKQRREGEVRGGGERDEERELPHFKIP